jgi:hypothetical protein
MDKINTSQSLRKRAERQVPAASGKRVVSDLTYNAFLGFPVASALANFIRRLKGANSRQLPTARDINAPGRDTPGKKGSACSAFGDLPPVPGSTEITFRN